MDFFFLLRERTSSVATRWNSSTERNMLSKCQNGLQLAVHVSSTLSKQDYFRRISVQCVIEFIAAGEREIIYVLHAQCYQTLRSNAVKKNKSEKMAFSVVCISSQCYVRVLS